MFVSVIFFGNDEAAPPCLCVSLLSEVISGALNFELLTNISCAIYTIKYICQIRIPRLDQLVRITFKLVYAMGSSRSFQIDHIHV